MLVNGEDIESIRREYNGLNLNFARFKRILLVEFNHDFFGRRDVDFKKNEKIMALGIQRYLNLNPVSYTHLDVYKRQSKHMICQKMTVLFLKLVFGKIN